MQLDKLQLDLRPRPNAQALDLGFALLRDHVRSVYSAWLALWLPWVALCGVLDWLFPDYAGAWLLLAWWMRPLLERAPLYILSRQVFGETVTWREALRAWPKQLGGGWFRTLTWWRLFMPGRGLYQPIWQLEGARGKVAAERRRVIGKNNTARSAYWFGVACANFEMILQVGLIAFIGIFLSDERTINPFAYLFGETGKPDSSLIETVTFAGYALAAGIIGPVYTACCFTLYLNRRATLEAWDIEIMLRQIKPPAAQKSRSSTMAAFLVPTLLALALWRPAPAEAAIDAAQTPAAQAAKKCTAPKWIQNRTSTRLPDQSPEQTKLRDEVEQMFDSDDLRGYVCKEVWVRKNPSPKKPEKAPDLGFLRKFAVLAQVIKVLLITAAICLVAWLLYRYRGKFGAFGRKPRAAAATEVAGLDIRPETLPEDVADTVRRLWAQGERRAALALLYRATLSRLVNQDGLLLTKGATEGDCLRLANEAHHRQQLGAARLDVITSATALWVNAAYGNRWPDSDTVNANCAAWHAQFDQAATRGPVQS